MRNQGKPGATLAFDHLRGNLTLVSGVNHLPFFEAEQWSAR